MSKAKAEITIYHVIDISKVTRYYLLVESTASAPSVPTTKPPSGWTTTEPSYETRSTKTLYFVDLTEFTDNTFQYSAVSKSSSYEAAKAAYNKALSTETFVTNHMELTTEGLVVGNLTEDTLKGNVLIDTDSVDIRVGDQVVASYQGKNIYLGKNSADAVIDLCDGTGMIKNSDLRGDETRCLEISSNSVINVTSVHQNNMSCYTSIIDGNVERARSMGIGMTTNPVWDGATIENGHFWITDGYWKTEYNSDGNRVCSYGNEIRFNSNDDEQSVVIGGYSSYEDYNNTAYISISGDKNRSKKSSIDLNADAITADGTFNFNNGYGTNLDVSGVLINSNSYIVLPNNKGLYSKKSDGTTTRNMLYMNSAGETILGYGAYNNNDAGSSTKIFGKAVHVYSKTLNTNFQLDAIKPYYEAGDSISSTWWALGFVAHTLTILYFTIPLARPVIGNPTITITSGTNKLTVRQNGKYIFGSSSGINPSSYSDVKLNADGNAIKITATFTSNNNAIVHCPCVVSADIKITFS